MTCNVIMFLFDVCPSICVQRTSNTKSSKTVKGMDFKFDLHVPRDSMHMTLNFGCQILISPKTERHNETQNSLNHCKFNSLYACSIPAEAV